MYKIITNKNIYILATKTSCKSLVYSTFFEKDTTEFARQYENMLANDVSSLCEGMPPI